MPVLRFTPNVPCRVQLKFPNGKLSDGRFGPQMMFSLMDGNIMFVPLVVEKQLLALQVRRGQPVEICKQQENGKTEWKVRRVEAAKPEAKPEPKPRKFERTYQLDIEALILKLNQKPKVRVMGGRYVAELAGEEYDLCPVRKPMAVAIRAALAICRERPLIMRL